MTLTLTLTLTLPLTQEGEAFECSMNPPELMNSCIMPQETIKESTAGVSVRWLVKRVGALAAPQLAIPAASDARLRARAALRTLEARPSPSHPNDGTWPACAKVHLAPAAAHDVLTSPA